MKSALYNRCIGVFEGGGVRGAAFAGAYRAAMEADIDFVGTVGTSAGAIAASLIAAGISADRVLELLTSDFSKFLSSPTLPTSTRGRIAVTASNLLGEGIQKSVRWHFAMGLYSSDGIGRWLNSVLLTALPHAHDPVQFGDLPKPLGVMAADLTSHGPYVWSKEKTANSPVAFAVQASCTIPFLFQPVIGEAACFVDGGILANLPLFLVPQLNLDSELPVLCFRLVGDRDRTTSPPRSGMELLGAVVDTVLNGATEVQLSIARERQVIDIPTGGIESMNFKNLSREDINALVLAGESAVRQFVNEEQIRVTTTKSATPRPPLQGLREGLLDQTADLIHRSSGAIWVLAGDLSWFRELHLAILLERLGGKEVRVICADSQDATLAEAIQGAVAIGATVVATQEQPLKGTIVNPGTESAEMIAIESAPVTHGRRYDAIRDRGFLQLIQERFENSWKGGRKICDPREPALEPIPTNEIVAALSNGVPHYKNLHIEVDQVEVHQLQPLTKCLEKFKLLRVEVLERLLASQGIENAARLKGSPWPISPPVIERIANGSLIVIDGAHRVYHARKSGRQRMRVVIVDNPSHPLPATPYPNWTHIQVLPGKQARSDRWLNYSESEFRPIRMAFRRLALP